MTGSIRESRRKQRSRTTGIREELKGAGESEKLRVQIEEFLVSDADVEVRVAAEQTKRLLVLHQIGEAHRQILDAHIQRVLLAEQCLETLRELSRLALAAPLGGTRTHPVNLEQTQQIK